VTKQTFNEKAIFRTIKNDIMQITLFPEVKEEKTPEKKIAPTFKP
jgi:hypothetical protein